MIIEAASSQSEDTQIILWPNFKTNLTVSHGLGHRQLAQHLESAIHDHH